MTTATRGERDAAVTGWVGRSLPRKEDERLLRGQGAFVDDEGMHRMGHAWFLRSPYAHAHIVSIDTSEAEAVPGVYAILTGEEVATLQQPFMETAPDPGSRVQDYCLAVEKVRYAGEPVAVVLAASADLARDAAEHIAVVYEPLPAVVDGLDAAGADAPVLHEAVGSNVIWHSVFDYGDIEWALEEADHVVHIDRLHFHRFTSAPLECNAALVHWQPGTDTVEIRANNQMPQIAAMFLGAALALPTERLRFVTGDIGGGFGIKITSFTYLTALALLSRKAGRPAKWTESRSEHLLASAHGNERTFCDIDVPVMADGTILGVRVRAVDDIGAYPRYEPLGGVIWSQVLPGCYRFRHLRVDYTTVVTNKCPVGPNRGYSRVQHLWMLERVVDIVAHRLGFDPVEIRRRNYIGPDDYPYETPNGCLYDSGNLPLMLDRALALIDYDRARARQAEARGTGRRIGIGIGSTLDSGTNNFGQARIVNPYLPFSGNGEAALVKLGLDGGVTVVLGTVPQGQGHETTTAQVVADILGVDPDGVAVRVGHDTASHVFVGFSGTYASQFAVTGLGAVMGAALRLHREISMVAAAALGADAADIELAGGAARVKGERDRAVPFAGIANLVYANTAALPPEVADAVTLTCRHVYRPPFAVPDHERKWGNLTLTYAAQVHACVVEIDDETGETRILDYAAVDECGRRINPAIIEGQVHGATAHGIAAALHETLVYDADGQLGNATFFDYHAATALDIPSIRTAAVECPSPFSPNGAKGMGEGGGAPLHALAAAIQDAVADSGAVVTSSHNPSERVWRLLHGEGADAVRVSTR
jgi:2-furoyl-CoA dehydrogenase large subunit